jgi:hypothetical protein
MNLKKQPKMILGYSTIIDKKETHFVDKIWSGLIKNELAFPEQIKQFESDYLIKTLKELGINIDATPKLHTIREDGKNRWKVGTKIDFFINSRKQDMFRFAPTLPVVSIQDIMITRNKSGKAMVFIDGKIFYLQDWSLEQNYKMLHFAKNDGFDTSEDFFEYFNTDFNGKIIHWTNLKY